jgi:hypothetical protein
MGWSTCLSCDVCGKDLNGPGVLITAGMACENGWTEHSDDEWWCDECGVSFVSVCFSVKLTREQVAKLNFIDGSVEMTKESMTLLTSAALSDQVEFAVAEVGCPEWAEEAGADPSCWGRW